jgi:hypothetical protein
MRKGQIILFILLGMIASCAGTQKIQPGDFVCKDHKTHRLSDRQEFADCFGVKPTDLDSVYIFSREGSANRADEIGSVTSRLNNDVADEIVDLIVKKLEVAFGNDLTTNWRLERIDLPVTFRIFTVENAVPIKVKAVAVVRKDDLAPRSLVRFLPLEYKMKLMKTNEQEMKEFEKDKKNLKIP